MYAAGNINYIRGVICFLLSILCGGINDILAKYICSSMHPALVAFFRFLFSTLTLLPVIGYYGRSSLVTNNFKIHFIRGALLFLGILCWIYGLSYVQVTTATVMSFSMPLFTLVLGSLFLKEKIIWQRWGVTLIGFIGIFVTLNPSAQDFNTMSLIFLGSAIVFAGLDVINKIFISQESMLGMMFYSSLVTVILGLPLAWMYWQIPTSHELLIFIAMGLAANLLLLFILEAFRLCDATAIAPYRYVELLITAGLGYLVFGHYPSTNTLYGAAIIIPATLFIAYSEKKNKDVIQVTTSV